MIPLISLSRTNYGDTVVYDEAILTNAHPTNWEFVAIWNKSAVKFNFACITGSMRLLET